MPALSVIDLAMFLLETPERPFNIGPLIVLDPPARGRDTFADRLSARMLKRPLGTPFNYRLHTPLIGVPSLEVDPNADPAAHLHRLTLPAPGNFEQLFADRVRTARDAARPLPAAVGPVGHRRPRRRQGGAVRQGAPRHHRRAHLRAGGVELARHLDPPTARCVRCGRACRAARARAPNARRLPRGCAACSARPTGTRHLGGRRCTACSPSRACARWASAAPKACRCPSSAFRRR